MLLYAARRWCTPETSSVRASSGSRRSLSRLSLQDRSSLLLRLLLRLSLFRTRLPSPCP